jgi:hypothetical protein
MLIDSDMSLFTSSKKFSAMELRRDGVNAIVERLNLEKFMEYYSLFNGSRSLPYHNEYHMWCMVLNCFEASFHENLTDGELRGLCAAAIMHDCGHSGGKEEDYVNIKVALDSLRFAQAYAQSSLLGLSLAELKIAENCIRATEYPYLDLDLTLPMKIIRDADLMQPYERNEVILMKQYEGLRQEMEIEKTEFAKGVFEFLGNVTWMTSWGRVKAETLDWENARHKLKKILS